MYLDPNDEYAFVLQWISESKEAMLPRIKRSARNLMMYQHKPSRNSYKEQAKRFDLHKARSLGLSDLEFERYKSVVETIPDGRSDIVFRSIETNVSQLSGGIGQLETILLDKSAILDDNLEQILSLADEQIYYNYLDKFRDMITRELFLYGSSYVYPRYDKKAKDIVVEMISQDKIIVDPIRFRRNKPRYIGFHKMISWQELDKLVEYNGKFLKTKNKVEVYAKNLKELMMNPSLGSNEEYADLQADIVALYRERKYKTGANNIDAKEKSKYQGEDVEVSYIWDLTTGTRYLVLNRRFVIEERKDDLEVVTKIAQEDRSQGVIETDLKKSIASPIIEIVAKQVPNSAYPVTPLDLYGEMFDEICAMMSLKLHNESIVGTVTPIGSDYDLAILSNGAPVSGVGVSGTDGTVGFINKAYNADFIDTRIQEREQRIVQALNAYSQIDMVQMIGDRATAKESGAAVGAVSAGHNSLIHTLELAFADIIRVVNLLTVRYMSDKTIKVNIDGELPTLNVSALALDSILNVKLKSEVEKERESKSMIAAQMLNIGAQNPYVNQEVFIPRVLKIAFGTLFPREELAQIIKMPEDTAGIQLAQQQAANHAKKLQLQQQVVDQDPMGRLQMQAEATMTPEDMELLTSELQADQNQYGDMATQMNTVEDESEFVEQPLTEKSALESQQNMLNVEPTETTTGDMAPSTVGLPPEVAGMVSNGTEI